MERTYDKAMARLEQLVDRMEAGELSIDELSESLKEAQSLIKFCRDKLFETDEQVKKLLESGYTDIEPS